MNGRPPRSPPFPYTTRFRSAALRLRARPRPAPLPGLLDRAGVRLGLASRPRRRLDLLRRRRSPPLLLPLLRQRRSEEHTSELQSRQYLVCRLLLEKKKSNSI